MRTDPIVIVSYARTPHGNMLGKLANISASELGAHAIQATIVRSKLEASLIEAVNMGCVLPAGQGQAPARQAALKAGLDEKVSATTINKMCGSGMKAAMLAHDSILAGSHPIMIAGGMESMTNAPYLLKKARSGYRLGHEKIYDHMFLDGLEDAYQAGTLMGVFADQTAEKYTITREEQDQFAIASIERAQAANKKGIFKNEIAPFSLIDDEPPCSTDEGIETAKPEKIPKLRPVFSSEGSVTPANASSISDGASALLLMQASTAQQLGLNPIATIVAHATHAQAPAWFTTAPIGAIETLLQKTGWDINEVDLFEINEAFAVVTLAAMKTLKLPHEKVNIHGGACVLGHPIGASGARIMITLMNALKTHNLKRGIATLCIGGGEATAIALEMNQ